MLFLELGLSMGTSIDLFRPDVVFFHFMTLRWVCLAGNFMILSNKL